MDRYHIYILMILIKRIKYNSILFFSSYQFILDDQTGYYIYIKPCHMPEHLLHAEVQRNAQKKVIKTTFDV